MSHLYRDSAVVLRTYKLGEADRIVVLLTAENGKVRAVAKGVRKTTSRFGARLEPMSHVRLLLYRGRELDIVSQAESVEPLSPMLGDLDRASQGMAVLEAADQLALEREPNPELYRMLVGVLRTIAASPRPAGRPGVLLEAARRRGAAPRARRLRALRRQRARRDPRRLRPHRGRGAVPILPFRHGDQPRRAGTAACRRIADKTGIGLAQTALGGDHKLVAVPAQLVVKRLAKEPFRRTETVRLRGVKEVDAEITGPADRRDGRVLVELSPVSAELPSAECDTRHCESASPQYGSPQDVS